MERIMKIILSLMIFKIVLVLTLSSTAFAQNEHLKLFHKIVDKDWVGHYVESEDSHYVHKLNFEFILDGNAIVETKKVDELGFEMITYYFYDWEINEISFLSLLNKEMNSSGRITVNNSTFTLEGNNYFQSGSSQFKRKYEVTKHGIFYDFFYIKKGNSWVQSHLIEYK
jgi:hypothetical protein